MDERKQSDVMKAKVITAWRGKRRQTTKSDNQNQGHDIELECIKSDKKEDKKDYSHKKVQNQQLKTSVKEENIESTPMTAQLSDDEENISNELLEVVVENPDDKE